MKKSLIGAAAAAATLVFATGALAVGPPYCGTYAAPAITAPSEGDAAKCQSAIYKFTGKYIKTLIKTRSKCLVNGDETSCPNTKDDAKVQGAAAKSLTKIASACGSTAGLGSSYAGASGSNAGSCTLSQNHGSTEIYLAETHGAPGVPDGNAARNDCKAGLAKAAQKFLPAILKSVDKCIDGRIKSGLTTGLGAACVGSLSPGGLTDPTDTKTADAIDKATTKMHDTIVGACTGLSTEQIEDLFGCPGAEDLDDLDACVSCSGLNAMFEIVGQQYAETGSIVSEGVQAIQTAVNDGGAGDKFLIASGDYDEGVTLPTPTCTIRGGTCTTDESCGQCAVTSQTCAENEDCSANACSVGSDNPDDPCTVNGDCPNGTCDPAVGNTCEPVVGDTCVSDGDDMEFVGCGAATDDRPRIFPPLLGAPLRGITAVGVDGLHFQALDVVGWANDGIFVSNADGVSFRDCLGDGDDLSTSNVDSVSTYAFFPVESTNVVVEGCEVVNVRDAGIYVGSSENIVVRHNLVYDNVTGIEIENSEFAEVYGNTAHDNTGGLLCFLLPGPSKQESGFHHFFDNVSYENNTPNFGIPDTTVGNVPDGTGLMIISDDDSVYENNLIMRNASYGILLVDQEGVNALVGDLFDPTSVDQDSERLQFLHNRLPKGGNANAYTPGLGHAQYAMALGGGTNGTCYDPVPAANQTSAPLGGTFDACP